MFRESGILETLDNIRENIVTSYLYGDPAYPISSIIQTPYKGAKLTEVEQDPT
jgi:hypothetical protein